MELIQRYQYDLPLLTNRMQPFRTGANLPMPALLCEANVKHELCQDLSRICVPDGNYDLHSQCHIALQDVHTLLCTRLPRAEHP